MAGTAAGTAAGYSRLQMALHWATAALIGANWLISDGMEQALDARLEGGLPGGLTVQWHVWAGSALMVLVLTRIVVRLAQGAPRAEGPRGFMDLAASAGHGVLYLLMLAVPALGAVTWFLKIDATGELHVLAMNLLMVVILGHAAMAIFHHYVLKDGLLKKMIPVA